MLLSQLGLFFHGVWIYQGGGMVLRENQTKSRPPRPDIPAGHPVESSRQAVLASTPEEIPPPQIGPACAGKRFKM